MQDIQNIPNPDVNSNVLEDDFGNHSDIERENESNSSQDIEQIPLPPTEPLPPAVEEPPETDKPPIGDEQRGPAQIV